MRPSSVPLAMNVPLSLRCMKPLCVCCMLVAGKVYGWREFFLYKFDRDEMLFIATVSNEAFRIWNTAKFYLI